MEEGKASRLRERERGREGLRAESGLGKDVEDEMEGQGVWLREYYECITYERGTADESIVVAVVGVAQRR